MTVLFQGKSLEKCPKGYTICSQLEELTGRPSANCMTTSECDLALKKASGEKEEEGQKEPESALEDIKQEEEELAKKKHQENVDNINDFLAMLEKGVVVDIKTGEMIGNLDLNNMEQVTDFFKSLGRLFSNETIMDSKLGGDLNQFLNIINSDKLVGSPEIVSGLTEKFLKNKMGIST